MAAFAFRICDHDTKLGARSLAIQVVWEAARHKALSDRASWLATLGEVDEALSCGPGQCAIVATAAIAGRIVGVSVGDCGAWLIAQNGIDELTANQVRRPLLGSGEAIPVAFAPRLPMPRYFWRPTVC